MPSAFLLPPVFGGILAAPDPLPYARDRTPIFPFSLLRTSPSTRGVGGLGSGSTNPRRMPLTRRRKRRKLGLLKAGMGVVFEFRSRIRVGTHVQRQSVRSPMGRGGRAWPQAACLLSTPASRVPTPSSTPCIPWNPALQNLSGEGTRALRSHPTQTLMKGPLCVVIPLPPLPWPRGSRALSRGCPTKGPRAKGEACVFNNPTTWAAFPGTGLDSCAPLWTPLIPLILIHNPP